MVEAPRRPGQTAERVRSVQTQVANALGIAKDKAQPEADRVDGLVRAIVLGAPLLPASLPNASFPTLQHHDDAPDLPSELTRFYRSALGISAEDPLPSQETILISLGQFLDPSQRRQLPDSGQAIYQTALAVINPSANFADHLRDGIRQTVLEMPADGKTQGQIAARPQLPVLAGWVNEVAAQQSLSARAELRSYEDGLKQLGLDTVRKTIERVFRHGATEDDRSQDRPQQIIPDSLSTIARFQRLSKRLDMNATLQLDPRQHIPGYNPPAREEDKPPVAKELERERSILEGETKLQVYRTIYDWMETHHESISSERAKKISKIFDIIFDSTRQVSEQAFLWATRYGLEATAATTSPEDFVWDVSLGGDQEPPALVEGYLIEPLLKLQRLQALGLQRLPTLQIVGTFYSQMAENATDKKGRQVNEQVHVFNSRTTLQRINAFVQERFGNITNLVRIIEFPQYSHDGPSRMLFAAMWNELPDAERSRLLKMFEGIRGVDTAANGIVEEMFGEGSTGSYPMRHIVSNGLMGANGEHILRWGAVNTEPQFWFASRVGRAHILSHGEHVLGRIDGALGMMTHQGRINTTDAAAMRNVIAQQLERWQGLDRKNPVQAQIGMEPSALYYNRRDEPTLVELIAGGERVIESYLAGASPDAAGRLAKMIAAYQAVTKVMPWRDYQRFLSDWHQQYVSVDAPPDEFNMSARLDEQASEITAMPSYVSGDQARRVLNFQLQ